MRQLSMFIEPESSLPNDAAPHVDRRDDWLNEALQAVPLPAGFLQRVGLLAEAAEANPFDRDDLLAGQSFAPNGRRRD
jgi:hypothetical protein